MERALGQPGGSVELPAQVIVSFPDQALDVTLSAVGVTGAGDRLPGEARVTTRASRQVLATITLGGAPADGGVADLPPQGYATLVTASRPRAYYRLSDPTGSIARDAAGSAHGVYAEGPSLGVPGLLARSPDRAVQLVQDAHVETPMVPPDGDFSVEALFLVSQPPQTFVGIASAEEYLESGFRLAVVPRGVLRFWSTESGGPDTVATIEGVVQPGQPYHLVAVKADARATLYANGLVVAQGSMRLVATPSPLVFGRTAGLPYASPVVLDEAAFYDRALTEAEVRAHAEAFQRGE